MATISWKGVSGDWTNSADWTGGALPGAADTASFIGAGAYTATLYSAATVGNVTFNAANALFYDASALTVNGIFSLQGGTLALAYGSLNGGTLAMAGGTLLAEGGSLNGVAVQGTLALSQANATLFVQNGLTLSGAGGVGAGGILLNGSYAALNFLGSQTLANANVTFGNSGSGVNQGGPATIEVAEAFGAAQGATLTLASNVWVQQTGTVGQIIVGGSLPTPYTDAVVSRGTLTDNVQGGTLTIGGAGNFINQGTIGISNGATLDIAGGGFANTGTVAVANATLDFGGTFASSLLGSLGNLSLSQAVVEIGGDAVNTGATLTVSAGSSLGALALAGTITGGTVIDQGGGLDFSPESGVLDGVTYVGTLTLGAGDAVTLADTAILTQSGGGAGTALINGSDAELLLEGLTSLGNSTITLGSNSGVAAKIGTTDTWLATAATTATLGARVSIVQGGAYAEIDANATSPVHGFGLADTLVNTGTIAANYSGGTFTIGGYGTFINSGTISASNQATLILDASVFSNTGTILLSGGATALLGGPADVYGQVPAWSNSGGISLNNATLILSGAMKTGQLGQISGNGNVVLAGTLANAGNTLTLGAGGQLPNLSLTGTIVGGTLYDPNGLLNIGTDGTALLDGVTAIGTLDLSGAGEYLRVRDGLPLYGTAEITGAGAELAMQGSEGLGQATVLLGAPSTAAVLDVVHDYTVQGGSTLSLGQSLTIVQSGLLANIGTNADVSGDAIINYGSITASTYGGTLSLGGADFINRGMISVSNGDTLAITAAQFADAGTISVTNAYISIADSLSLAQLGNLVLTNATVGVSGTLSNAGNTLQLGYGTAIGRMTLTGTIAGGTILDTGGGLGAGGSATLSGVKYEGVLDLSRPFQQLTISNGINITDTTGTLPGTLLLTGGASRVLTTGNQILNNVTVMLGSVMQNYYGQPVPPAELAASAGSTLSIGPNATVREASYVAWLGDCRVGNWTDKVVNNGTIIAATATGILTVGSTFFANNAVMSISNLGNVMFAGVGFTNNGVISISPGSDLMLSLYSYYSAPNSGPVPFTNVGTMRMLGGALVELLDGGLFPSVPIVNSGLIQGVGNLNTAIINNGLIEAKYGPNLSVTGSLTGTGSLQIDPNCVLELSNGVATGQTIGFTSTSETLRIDSPMLFNGHIMGFAAGDAIDFAGHPVTSVSLNNGTLMVGTAAGQVTLQTTTPLAGAISVATDTHAGSAIFYTPQSGGSQPATIGVYQPHMEFWASPVGDVFTGPSSAMQGATIGNWSAADSLDIIDMTGTKTTVAYAQASGQGTITVTDGVHTDNILLVGSYNASWFHVNTDANGGALITYTNT